MARGGKVALTERDEHFMAEALALARRGLYGVSPNPMVGAILVRRGRAVSTGYHRRFGGPHAEVTAIKAAGRAARGADLYVTLEPCAHHGRTPPCAEAIVRAGISRVVFAVDDPNPATRGIGPRLLRRHGILVSSGALEARARDLNAPYFHWRETGRPWVILKWAMTLDGKIATAKGESRWITGEKARAVAHRLRRRVDAILVGTETARLDDPLLAPRPPRGRLPRRVVLDRRGTLPMRLRLLRERDPRVAGETVYATTRHLAARRRRLLEERGVHVLEVRSRSSGLDLGDLLKRLGGLGISQLLVEGGGALAGSLLSAGRADEVAAFVAPRLLGGETSRPALGGSRVNSLESTPWIENPQWRRLGVDYLLTGRIKKRAQPGSRDSL